MTLRLLIPVLSVAALLAGCETYGGGDGGDRRMAYSQGPGGDEQWDAPHYYRDGDYQERTLSRDDRVYRGGDGRYYCRRPDGTAGLIVGGIAGGLLGSAIAPGGSKTLGAVLGAAGGAAIGDSVAHDSARCR